MGLAIFAYNAGYYTATLIDEYRRMAALPAYVRFVCIFLCVCSFAGLLRFSSRTAMAGFMGRYSGATLYNRWFCCAGAIGAIGYYLNPWLAAPFGPQLAAFAQVNLSGYDAGAIAFALAGAQRFRGAAVLYCVVFSVNGASFVCSAA